MPQPLWMAGIEEFTTHPPLHYFMSAIFLKLFGIGTWQVLLFSSLVAILMIATISIFLFKTFNWMTAALFLTLTIIFYGFYFSSLSLRSDLSFGAIFTLYLFFFGRFLFNDLSGRKLIFNSFIVGILSIAVLATHWFGFFVQLYTLFYVIWLIRKIKCIPYNFIFY